MTSLSNTDGFLDGFEVFQPGFLPVSHVPTAGTLTTHRRSHYYNEMVVFRVKDTLFREPKSYFIENSQFFRTLFDNLKSSASVVANSAGQSDETPLELEDISVEDFECLLSVISPINPHERSILSINEWKSVMRLSTKWGISSLRKRCIQQLSPLRSDMSVASKILFARECKAVGWLADAYNQLAQRKESITEEEEAAIGLLTSMRILCVREQWLVNKESVSNSVSYHISNRTGHNYRSSILSVFYDEIDEMSDGNVESEVVHVSSGEPERTLAPLIPQPSQLEAKMPDPLAQIAHTADESKTVDPIISGVGKKKAGAKKKKKS